jgi:pyrroloquinoline quinone biosynthesis protein B
MTAAEGHALMDPLPRVSGLFLLLMSACAAPDAQDSTAGQPYVLVLGSAQDGGLPQIGCQQDLCKQARRDPSMRRMVSSLLLVDPRNKKRWLIDATPDLPEQLELANQHAPRPMEQGRPPLFDGVFLTHAHMGHYTGLMYLGREVYGSDRTKVWCSRRMANFLQDNGPWKLLVEEDHIQVETLVLDQELELATDLGVTAFQVPHRDEFSDTLGFRIEGPSKTLIFIPDIDKWSQFDGDIELMIEGADHALLDGTFFADGEIPGRAMADIPHPFIEESLDRFSAMPARERLKIQFIHLNHTNPATDPDGEAAATITAAGCGIASDGQVIEL